MKGIKIIGVSLLSTIVVFAFMIGSISMANATDEVERISPVYKVAYDYPPEDATMYAALRSWAYVYSSYITIANEELSTNITLGYGPAFSVKGKTHYVTYSGMAPNWTQIDKRTISNSF